MARFMYEEEYPGKYTARPIRNTWAREFAKFILLCQLNNIPIDKIGFLQNGFIITFKGLLGDAILHDNSYGNTENLWETFRFDWDYDDVSTHTSEELVALLKKVYEKEVYNEQL